MKSKLYLIIFILSFINVTYAQISFEQTYGGAYFEEAKSVRQTSDGGYIIGGTNLLKLDELGAVEWSKPYPSVYASITADQGYILINSSSPNVTFTKVNTIGDTLWQTDYSEGVWANEGNHIEQTQDGGYIVAGRFQSVTGSGMLLMKLNSQGNKVWKRTYSEATSAAFCYGKAAQQTSDGGYIIAGFTYIDYYEPTRHKDVFIVKTDSVGTEQWRKYFGGAKDDVGSFVRQDDAGNYYVGARTESYTTGVGADMYLIKLNNTGDSLWTRTYGGSLDETAAGLWPTKDGGCVFVGSSHSFTNGDTDAYMVKTSSDGITHWTNNFGGIGTEHANSVQQTSDDGFIIAGSNNTLGAGDFDMYLIKTDSLGQMLVPNLIDENVDSNVKVEVFPNPSNGVFSFKSESVISEMKIRDLTGKIVYSPHLYDQSSTVDLSHQSTGVYFYQIKMENNNKIHSGKIILN